MARFRRSGTGLEHLRFDVVDSVPHYHYIEPNVASVTVLFDDVAEPDVERWVFERLESHLPTMLAATSADDLSAAVAARYAEFRGALTTVRSEVASMRQGRVPG